MSGIILPRDRKSTSGVASCKSSLLDFLPYLAQNVPVLVRGVTHGWHICTLAANDSGSLLSDSSLWSLFSKTEQVIHIIRDANETLRLASILMHHHALWLPRCAISTDCLCHSSSRHSSLDPFDTSHHKPPAASTSRVLGRI